ncbi:MAG: hypothetical protein WDO15_13850 [Bacteroidota bacterium]
MAPTYLISVDNDTIKTVTASLKLFDAATTAILFINVETKEPHFIIQLVNTSNKVIREAVDKKQITFKYLTPENVKIRAIIDTNANGKWDTAIYPENREPERMIYFLNSDKKFDTPLRANWEVGPLKFRF